MLRPSRLALVEPPAGSTRLQAVLESLVALLLEGKIQAGLVHGEWGEDSLLLGYYMPAPPGRRGGLRRRITGGPSAGMRADTNYAGIVLASESLSRTAGLAGEIAQCTGAHVWGATRIGPSTLAAGVIELMGGQQGEETVRCLEEALGYRIEVYRVAEPGSAERIERAYRHPAWARYAGAEPLPYKGVSSRGGYHVRVGLALAEGRFISDARVDGIFMAAPPNEPFNTLSNIRGMPLGDQALLSVEVRAEKIEWYGLGPRMFVEAFLEAARSAGVEIED